MGAQIACCGRVAAIWLAQRSVSLQETNFQLSSSRGGAGLVRGRDSGKGAELADFYFLKTYWFELVPV